MDNSYNTLCRTEMQFYEKSLDHSFKITYGDVQQIPLEEESVNLVVSSQDFWSWQDKKKAIKEIYRVMTKNGFAYIGGSFENNDKLDLLKIENAKELLIKVLIEMKILFDIKDNESGIWFILHKIH